MLPYRVWLLKHLTPIIAVIVVALILSGVVEVVRNGSMWRILLPLSAAVVWALIGWSRRKTTADTL
jgi:hypothetical protein